VGLRQFLNEIDDPLAYDPRPEILAWLQNLGQMNAHLPNFVSVIQGLANVVARAGNIDELVRGLRKWKTVNQQPLPEDSGWLELCEMLAAE
jgi:hypothetical protein